MKRYSMRKLIATAVFALVTVLTVMGVYPALADAPPDASVGLISSNFFNYTGESFSKTFSMSAAGWLLDAPECTFNAYIPGTSWFHSATLGTSNQFTLTKNDLVANGIQPGVYEMRWYITWFTGGIPYYDTINSSDYSLFWTNDLIPVSVDKAAKTVHYTSNIYTGRYEGDDHVMHKPLTALRYAAFAPDATQVSGSSLTIPDADFYTANVDIAYTKATYNNDGDYQLWFSADASHALRARSPVDRFTFLRYYSPQDNWMPYLQYSPSYTRSFTEHPYFYLNQVTTSTTPPRSWPEYAIEPAYGDSVIYHWTRNYNEFHVKSIALYKEYDQSGSDGTYYPSKNSIGEDKFYKEIPNSEAFLDDEQNNKITSPIVLPDTRYAYGELTWPGKDANGKIKHYPTFPRGKHKVGIKYDDGHVEFPGFFVDVATSVYQVFASNSDTIYGGMDDPQTSDINYTLSSDTDSCEVRMNNVLLDSTDHKKCGPNTIPNGWNNALSDGTTRVHSGPVPIVTQTDGTHLQFGEIGTFIGSDTPTTNGEFTPPDQTLKIKYRLTEPVKREQATCAKLYAVVYNEAGVPVKVLCDGEVNANVDPNIYDDYDITKRVGYNELTWDGTGGEPASVVSPGDYTISLFAVDDAGVGCESLVNLVHVTVLDNTDVPSQVMLELSQVSDPDSTAMTVAGFTDSESNVILTDSAEGGVQHTLVPDADGAFEFTLNSAIKGNHTITVTTTQAGSPPIVVQKTMSFFVGDTSFSPVTTVAGNPPVAVAPPYGEAGRFIGGTQSASISVTPEATDTYDVSIIDPFYSLDCIPTGSNNAPQFASTLLNGTVTPRLVKTIWTNHTVTAGNPAVVTWDGSDGTPNGAAAGPYIMHVARTNTDGLLESEEIVNLTVDRPVNAPTISATSASVDGNSICISWNTNPATTGAVVYEGNAGSIARVPWKELSTTHVVRLPVVQPGETITYWILAKDAGGNSAVSQKGTVTAEDGENIDSVETHTVSDTEVKVSWNTGIAQSGRAWRIEYARVRPEVTSPSWQTLADPLTAEEHIVQINNLTPNSEYVYRIVCSDSGTQRHPIRSPFYTFVTENTMPAVAITGPTEDDIVSGTFTVTANISDTFTTGSPSGTGIARVEINADGHVLPLTPMRSGNVYTFNVDASTIGYGFTILQVTAIDDYGNRTSRAVTVYATSQSAGASAMRAMDAGGGQLNAGNNASATGKKKSKGAALPHVCKLAQQLQKFAEQYNVDNKWNFMFSRARDYGWCTLDDSVRGLDKVRWNIDGNIKKWSPWNKCEHVFPLLKNGSKFCEIPARKATATVKHLAVIIRGMGGTASIQGMATAEESAYTSRGYIARVFQATDCHNGKHLARVIKRCWGTFSAFSYCGHGYPGQLCPFEQRAKDPKTGKYDWYDDPANEELTATKLAAVNVVPSADASKPIRRMDYLRFIGCLMGNPDSSGNKLYLQALTPYDPAITSFAFLNTTVDGHAITVSNEGVGFWDNSPKDTWHAIPHLRTIPK